MTVALQVTASLAGTASKTYLSVRFIDALGEMRAVAVPIDAGVTNAEISAFAVAFGNATQAVIWSIEKIQVFGAIPSNTGATTDANNSVRDNIVTMFKDNSGNSFDFFIPAPLEAMVLEGSVPDTTQAQYTALLASIASDLGLNDTPVSARFTQRRDINTKVSL